MNSRLLFLCGLAALPACGPEAERDVTKPGGGDAERLPESCEDYLQSFYSCFAEEETGDLDDEVEAYCELLLDDVEPGCGQAQEEVFACLAAVDCDELFEASPEHPCAEVVVHASEQCPEQIGLCVTAEFSGSNASCGMESVGCFDGAAYSADCTAAAEGVVCTCDDGSGPSTVMADFSCGDDDVDEAMRVACGFPAGA